MLDLTHLLDSNVDMTFFISVLSVGLTKKGNIGSVFKKIWIFFCENEILTTVLFVIEEK